MDCMLATLDKEVQDAEAAWCAEIASHVVWPDPKSTTVNAKSVPSALAAYEKYLNGKEARQIARTIFLLKAAPIDTREKIVALIERHNQSLQADLEDPKYYQRTGLAPGRLRESMFDTPGKVSMMINAVLVAGAGALHRTAFRNLLVRNAGKGALEETLDLLIDAGFLRSEPGPNHSELLISDGRLEAAHETYLKTIVQAVEAVQNEVA